MKRQQYEFEKNKALQKENRLSKTPITTPSAQSTATSALSSPIKRFNANLPTNPRLNSTSENSFPLEENNEMYIIEILDDDGKVRETPDDDGKVLKQPAVETQFVKTTTQQKLQIPEQTPRKQSIKPNIKPDSALNVKPKNGQSRKKKKSVLLISVKGLTNNKHPKISNKSKSRLESNTSSPVKRTRSTPLAELEQNISEPSNKRRRLNA